MNILKVTVVFSVFVYFSSAANPPGSSPPPGQSAPQALTFGGGPDRDGVPGVEPSGFVSPPVAPIDSCPDNHRYCQGRANRGECNINPNWMKPNCQRSCRTCQYTCPSCDCFDDHPNCWWWAQNNECNRNPGYMLRRCKQSCDNCPGGFFSAGGIRSALPEDEEGEVEEKLEKKAGPAGPPFVAAAATECEDASPNCNYWAERGECDERPYFMKMKCQKSCDTCGWTYKDLGEPEPIPGCENEHPLCEYWKKVGHCDKHSGYMKKNCKLSCGTCD